MMYQKILVPLDGSKLAECVLPYVEALATGCDVKDIILFRVCETPFVPADYPASIPESWEKHVDQIKKYEQKQCGLYLEDQEQRLKKLGFSVRSDSALGNAADEIVDYAAKNEIDLIVMASHGRSGISRWAFSSVTEKVLRATCVPIMMVRAPGCVPGIR